MDNNNLPSTPKKQNKLLKRILIGASIFTACMTATAGILGIWFYFKIQNDYEKATQEWLEAGGGANIHDLIHPIVPEDQDAGVQLAKLGVYNSDYKHPGLEKFSEVLYLYNQQTNYDEEIELSNEDWIDIENQLEDPDIKEAIDLYMQAAQRPDWNSGINYTTLSPNTLIPSTGGILELEKCMALLADIQVRNNNYPYAVEIYKANIHIASLPKKDPMLVTLLTSVACVGINLESIQKHFENSPDFLPHTYSLAPVLSSVNLYESLPLAVRMEYHGMLKPAVQMIVQGDAGSYEVLRKYGVIGPLLRLNETTCIIEYTHMLKAFKDPYYVASKLPDYEPNKYNIASFLAAILIPSMSGVVDHLSTIQSKAHIYGLGIALNAYKEKHGSYPDTLHQLTPDIIDSIPEDTFSPHGYVYQKSGDTFLLYSVGPDLQDNGGDNKPVDKLCDGTIGDIVWTGPGHVDFKSSQFNKELLEELELMEQTSSPKHEPVSSAPAP